MASRSLAALSPQTTASLASTRGSTSKAVPTRATAARLPSSFPGKPLRLGRAHEGVQGPLAPSRRRLHVASVLKESQDLALGTRAPDFLLPEPLTGRQWSLSDFEGCPALLVAFVCNHCPYVVHVRDEFIKLAGEYMTKEGLGVLAISSNSSITHPQDGPEAMARDAKAFAMPFPYLFDETQEVAKAYKAACTPDFYIFKKEGRRPFELVYHGQMDDSRPKNGKPVTGRDLRLALDHVLSGRPYPHPQKPSIGCNIKWNPGQEPEYF